MFCSCRAPRGQWPGLTDGTPTLFLDWGPRFGFSGEHALPGTVFRVPLRTQAQARRSAFARGCEYDTPARLARMVAVLRARAEDTSLLLFARHRPGGFHILVVYVFKTRTQSHRSHKNCWFLAQAVC